MEDLERWFHNTVRTGHADYCPASDGYFRALGIPLLRGAYSMTATRWMQRMLL